MRIPILNIYYLLCYAWSHMEESDVVDVGEIEEFDELADLFGKVLSEGTFRLLRRGIDRGYREVTEEIPGVRGKLQVATTVKRALQAQARTVCTYEEMSHDVVHNRILRSSLGALLQVAELHSEVRKEVSLAYRKLAGIEVVRVTRKLFRQIQLDRNMRMYRFLLNICELLHESLLVDRESGQARFQDFSEDDATMWRLFEDFVAEFYGREQNRYRVNSQKKVPWHGARAPSEADLSRVPEMQADVILESEDRRIILDTKFYSEPFAGRHGARKLHSGNLYQLLAYLRNRQATRPEGPRYEGVLLYPTVDESVRVDVKLDGFWIHARSVDLNRRWREVHREMLSVLEH